jgi:hypothetical protein
MENEKLLTVLKHAGIALRFYAAWMKKQILEDGSRNTSYPFGEDTEKEVSAEISRIEYRKTLPNKYDKLVNEVKMMFSKSQKLVDANGEFYWDIPDEFAEGVYRKCTNDHKASNYCEKT